MRVLTAAFLALFCLALATPVHAVPTEDGTETGMGFERASSRVFEGLLPPGPVSLAPAPSAPGAAPDATTARRAFEASAPPMPRSGRALPDRSGASCALSGEIGPFPLRL